MSSSAAHGPVLIPRHALQGSRSRNPPLLQLEGSPQQLKFLIQPSASGALPGVLALLLRQDQLQRFDAHFHHGVVRLKGGEVLQPQARGHQNAGDGAVVPSRPSG